MAIQELRDRNFMMQDLNGKLLNYNIQMQNEEGRRSKDSRKHGLVLNVANSDESDINNDELSMFIHRFQRYKISKARGAKKGSSSIMNEDPKCYKYRRSGHWIKNYLRWEHEGKKGKVEKLLRMALRREMRPFFYQGSHLGRN